MQTKKRQAIKLIDEYMNESIKTNGQIGTENYKVDQCPFHVPKENLNFMKMMSNEADKNTHTSPNDCFNVTGTSWKGCKK